jgi:hypothetical protein
MSFLAEQEEAADRAAPRWKIVERDVSESKAGTHVLHRFIGRWGGGEVGEWVVLCDRASGEAVLDMARVKNAKVRWRDDGALLVRVEAPWSVRLFIVDPQIRTFRMVGFDRSDRPVAELQGAVAGAAWELGADGGPAHPRNSYVEHDFSPDGRLIVETSVEPQRMSHETRSPRLIDAETGETLLGMPDGLYDGSVAWLEGSRLQLSLRHYTMPGGMGLYVDWAKRTFEIQNGPDRDLPLTIAPREIARHFKSGGGAAAPAPAQEQGNAGFLISSIIGILLMVAAIAFALSLG